jgi:exopolysaccharide biosynthesis predicted pyruvyltransferase EpsI
MYYFVNNCLISSSIDTCCCRFLDPAYHKNVGDHMITLGELEFLDRLGFSGPQKIQQCGYVQAGSFVESCEDFLRQPQSTRTSTAKEVAGAGVVVTTHQPAVALWHGGGNWGDIWRHIQPKRIDSFSLFLQNNYSIVGMPQSLYYSDKSLGEMDATHLRRSISQGLGFNSTGGVDKLSSVEEKKMALDRIHLAWREVESYNRAKELYPFVTNLLVPDIAFQLGPYEALPPRDGSLFDVDLLFFLRDDRESTLSKYRSKGAIREILESIPGSDGLRLMIVDWVDRLELFESKDHFFTNTSIQLLSMGRVVICDRLHAAILCYLAGIPFVYIDQSTGKISKSLRVAFDSWDACKNGDIAMWAGAETLQEAIKIATSFLQKYDLQMNRFGKAHA